MIGFILLINGTFCAPIENNNEVFELVRQIRRARPQQPNSYPQGSWFDVCFQFNLRHKNDKK
ncbi:hypothetical protein BLOT_004620 [Blomia tropicalis]|nr:hypothetical protein BLOT_004620 [Blomia tropicalis]